jgi:hypothetical protein
MLARRSTPSGVAHLVAGAVASGYRLYTVPMLGRADLIGESGKVLHSGESPDDRWEQAVLTPDGSVLVVGVEAKSAGRTTLACLHPATTSCSTMVSEGNGREPSRWTLSRMRWSGPPRASRSSPSTRRARDLRNGFGMEIRFSPNRIEAVRSRSRRAGKSSGSSYVHGSLARTSGQRLCG